MQANEGMTMRPVAWAHGYFVSADGRVWSTLRADRLSKRAGETHEVRGGVAGNGYRVVRLAVAPGRHVSAFVHHLIAEAFLGPRPTWHEEIRHLDGNKLNCAAANLSWGTRRENRADADRHGRSVRGSRVRSAKLNEASVMAIRALLAEGRTNVEVAAAYGVTSSLVSMIRTRRIWRHV